MPMRSPLTFEAVNGRVVPFWPAAVEEAKAAGRREALRSEAPLDSGTGLTLKVKCDEVWRETQGVVQRRKLLLQEVHHKVDEENQPRHLNAAVERVGLERKGERERGELDSKRCWTAELPKVRDKGNEKWGEMQTDW